jgi:hypothetical protein
MNSERIKIELSIGLLEADAQEALDQFCNYLRSGLSTCQHVEVTSLDVRDETIDLQLDEIAQTVLVDVRSSSSTDKLDEQVADDIASYFWDHPSLYLGNKGLKVELISRRREAIAAQKAKPKRTSA